MNPMGTAVIRPKKSQKPIASRSTWVCSSMCMSVNSSQDGLLLDLGQFLLCVVPKNLNGHL
jgi:hypothetical protein